MEDEELILPLDDIEKDIDPRDIETPDHWIPRNPDLIRLTGNHPFNSEPPLKALVANGFLTPLSLHFVRNRGPCPRLQWETHRVQVSGLVRRSLTLSMAQLAAISSISVPVTLMSSANRRRELGPLQPVTETGKWSAAGIATSLWTGARVSEILEACDVDLDRARYVRFRGVGYSSSVSIDLARDPLTDILIAYKQNDLPLLPDHGFPARVIIPGRSSERMVKWVTNIDVLDHDPTPESDFCVPQINAAISSPGPGEDVTTVDRSLLIQGYAFCGGGRKVASVSIAVGSSDAWKQADIEYPEENISLAPRNGHHWCWALWSCPADLPTDLEPGSLVSIRCRAVDQEGCSQPETMTWNAQGLGNNSHYRIYLTVVNISSDAGILELQCSHDSPQ
mmetsp:Transcript_17438/g.36203  ORF Transcript_17438/g.36203 Transcript_17438/m.36203 type:complete len:393 (+) Transcript_17438:1098-2276(+)